MTKALYLLIILFALLEYIKCGHIYSWDIKTYYDYDGYSYKYDLLFKLE